MITLVFSMVFLLVAVIVAVARAFKLLATHPLIFVFTAISFVARIFAGFFVVVFLIALLTGNVKAFPWDVVLPIVGGIVVSAICEAIIDRLGRRDVSEPPPASVEVHYHYEQPAPPPIHRMDAPPYPVIDEQPVEVHDTRIDG